MKPLLIVFIWLVSISAYSQNGTHYLSVKGGVGIREIYSGSFSYDVGTKYHNQYEMFGEFIESRESKYRTMIGGFVFKPVQLRGVNSVMRWRLGAGLGTDFNKFVGAPQLGWEISQTFKNRMELILENKNQVLFGAPKSEKWRFVIDIGVRIPLN